MCRLRLKVYLKINRTIFIKGYSRNDRVGKSYLEYQYEDVLKGTKKQMKYTTDKSGRVISSEVLNPGSRGHDLQLTIDIDLQKK